MRHYLAFGAGIALTIFGAAGQASATQALLGPSVSSASCNSNNPGATVTDASQCKLQGAQAQVSQAPFVALEAVVNDPAGIATQDAFADLSYQFAVVGGASAQTVTIDIFTNLIAEADANTGAVATMDYGPGLSVRVCQGDEDNCTASQFHDMVSYTATVGVAQDIAFHIAAENTFSLGGRAFASADPLITIALADNPDGALHIIQSDGVGNGLPGSVPEPAAWALMLAGFGLSGAALRRRRAVRGSPVA